LDKFRVLLFAMTGYGNNALKVLLDHASAVPVGLFTVVRPEGPYPYYDCESINDMAARAGVDVYEGLSLRDPGTVGIIKDLAPDLIVVSTYNRIIPAPVISIPRFGILNVHPSLLPAYRGASPTFWALANGETESGISILLIEDEGVDNGRIVSQVRVALDPDETEGTLRSKLASLSEGVLASAIDAVIRAGGGARIRDLRSQDRDAASVYPMRTAEDARIDIGASFTEIRNRIRASTPYPGAFLEHRGRRYEVKGAALLGPGEESGGGADGRHLVVETPGAKIRFTLKQEHDGG